MAKEQTEKAEEVAGGGQDTKKQPSSVQEGFTMFMESQATAAKAKETKKPLQPEEKGAAPKFRIVDEAGKEVPFTIKVDGADIEVTDPEKLKTYAQLGFHGSQRLETLNKRDEELKSREQALMEQMKQFQTGKEMLTKFKQAIEEGRLIINPPGKAPSAKEEELEIDEELYSEPATKELKQKYDNLKKDFDKISSQLEATNKLMLGKMVQEQKELIDKDIVRMKQIYPHLMEKEVWEYLAEVDEDGMPVHNVESAAKLSHEAEANRFQEFLTKNPDLKRRTKEEEDAIIAKYLEEKKKLEEAPVASPSGSPVSTPSTTQKKREFKNMAEAAQAGAEFLRQKQAAKANL